MKIAFAICAATAASSGGLHAYATNSHVQSQDLVAYRLDQIDKRLDRMEERLGYTARGTD